MSLPNGYIQLEYIESSGTQWINTNYNFTSSFRIVAKFEITKNTSARNPQIIGVTPSNYNNYAYGRERAGDYQVFVSWANSGDIVIMSNQSDIIGIHELDWNRHVFTDVINGVTKTYTFESISITSTNKFSIFGNATYTNQIVESGRIYSYKLYDNDVLVRDFIPCLKLSDGAIGLYDQQNNQFYGNSGTGVFYGKPLLENNISLSGNPLDLVVGEDVSLIGNFKKNLAKIRYYIGI